MSTRYTADIDLRNANDSHTIAIASVPARSRVLDIGLADGSVARVLGELGCKIWGVEIDEQAAAEARRYCEHVVVGDVEQLDLPAALGADPFDVILLLDVLEHLRDPGRVLAALRGLLAPEGYVVASIPNVTHAAVRVQLLEGRFVYTDLGLLDRTHVRFFDAESVEELFSTAGYEVFESARVTRPIDATEIPVDRSRVPADVEEMIKDDPEAETYQFILLAAPRGSEAARRPPLLPARVLQARVQELEALLREAGDHIEHLTDHAERVEAELRRLVTSDPQSGPSVLEVLDVLLGQVADRRQVLAELLVDLQET